MNIVLDCRLCNPKFILWSPNSPCDATWKWTFRRQLGLDEVVRVEPLMVSAIRDQRTCSPLLSLSASRGCSRTGSLCKPGRVLLPGTELVSAMIFHLPNLPTELWKMNFCCLSSSACGILLKQPKLMINIIHVKDTLIAQCMLAHNYSAGNWI